MANQEMVEITVHDVSENSYQKVQAWADAHNMSVDEAASYAVCETLKNQTCFQLLAIMWDKGINNLDKLNKAMDIIIAHRSDAQTAFAIIEKTIDRTSQPELPYNPYTELLKKYTDRQGQEVAANA
jgi:hypothetical protein